MTIFKYLYCFFAITEFYLWLWFCSIYNYNHVQEQSKGLKMLFKILVLSVLVLSCASHGNAGVTSSFVRSEWPAVDIPLDSEVFAAPKGYNAPQQVSFHFDDNSIMYNNSQYLSSIRLTISYGNGIFVATPNYAHIFGLACSLIMDAGSINDM